MSILSTSLDLLFPRFCLVCGRAADAGLSHICWDCRQDLHLISRPFCEKCGDPVEGEIQHEYVCSWCAEKRVAFDQARSAGRYRGALRKALQAFKYNLATYACADLAELLGACVDVHYSGVAFDAVTFVPLYPARERHRTYNQARLLAAALSSRMRLGAAARTLRRVRSTGTQTDLSAAERRRNVRHAFEPLDPHWLQGRTLLLVDDVMTTGATVDECSRTLRRAGAARVYVVTVGRG